MKRAEVFRNPNIRWESEWRVAVHRGDISQRHLPIRERDEGPPEMTYTSHAEALAHALHEVGLTPTNPEKEN